MSISALKKRIAWLILKEPIIWRQIIYMTYICRDVNNLCLARSVRLYT